jgi:hypothetical protein
MAVRSHLSRKRKNGPVWFGRLLGHVPATFYGYLKMHLCTLIDFTFRDGCCGDACPVVLGGPAVSKLTKWTVQGLIEWLWPLDLQGLSNYNPQHIGTCPFVPFKTPRCPHLPSPALADCHLSLPTSTQLRLRLSGYTVYTQLYEAEAMREFEDRSNNGFGYTSISTITHVNSGMDHNRDIVTLQSRDRAQLLVLGPALITCLGLCQLLISSYISPRIPGCEGLSWHSRPMCDSGRMT